MIEEDKKNQRPTRNTSKKRAEAAVDENLKVKKQRPARNVSRMHGESTNDDPIDEVDITGENGNEVVKLATKASATTITKREAKQKPKTYDIERIVRMHMLPNGTPQFEVKWEGYPSSENTWEPQKNIPSKIIAQFRSERKAGLVKSSTLKEKRDDKKLAGEERKANITPVPVLKFDRSMRATKVTASSLPRIRVLKLTKIPEKAGEAGPSPNAAYGKRYRIEDEHNSSNIRVVKMKKREIRGEMELLALLEYSDGEREEVPTVVLKKIAPSILIEFYEGRIITGEEITEGEDHLASISE